MANYIPVDYDRDDTLYITSFGTEPDPSAAHWGPGIRKKFVLHYVLFGSGFFCGKKVNAGDGFCIYPGELHEYHSSKGDPWLYFWVILGGAHAEYYIKNAIQPNADGLFSHDLTPQLTRLAEKLRLSQKPLGHFEALSAFFGILDVKSRSEDGENPIVRSAKNYIRNNCHTHLTVKSTAYALCINDRYLYNLFIRHAGISPKKYIDNCRIETASELLTDTDASISEIAFSVGFDDVSEFSRFWTARLGISPTEYRKAQRKENT